MKPVRRLAPGARRQRGVVLYVALIVLIVMALVGIAMMRGSGSGISIAGNLTMKQNATNVADIGTEAARTWLMAQTAGTLSNDQPGYYSSWCGPLPVPCVPPAAPPVDPSQLDWSASGISVQVTTDDGTGNAVRYIVQRLCANPNMASNDPNQQCADVGATGDVSGQSHGGIGYPGPGPSISAQPFYRISSQVIGPKNTVSYIQVVMQ
jgi:Tfp pilus assembly protein PilX